MSDFGYDFVTEHFYVIPVTVDLDADYDDGNDIDDDYCEHLNQRYRGDSWSCDDCGEVVS